jgi:predicted nucleic acid-binding protein
VDCLIAAVSISHDALLFTLDDDFSRMTAHCNLRLLPIPNGP